MLVGWSISWSSCPTPFGWLKRERIENSHKREEREDKGVRKKKIEVQSQQNLDEPSIALLLVS
jgi:hypothetical protein